MCSLAAGCCAAALAKKRHRPAVLVMSGLLLATGAVVQYDIGALMPVWYHLTFLALIVPVCVVGGAIIYAASALQRWRPLREPLATRGGDLMKRFVLVIVGIAAVVVIAAFYMGAFQRIAITEEDRGPYTLVYRDMAAGNDE